MRSYTVLGKFEFDAVTGAYTGECSLKTWKGTPLGVEGIVVLDTKSRLGILSSADCVSIESESWSRLFT